VETSFFETFNLYHGSCMTLNRIYLKFSLLFGFICFRCLGVGASEKEDTSRQTHDMNLV
jgi:hypothetical protein